MTLFGVERLQRVDPSINLTKQQINHVIPTWFQAPPFLVFDPLVFIFDSLKCKHDSYCLGSSTAIEIGQLIAWHDSG